MVLSLPRDPATKIMGAIAVHLLLTLLYTWIGCGNENPASLMRRTLLDEEIAKGIPHINEEEEEKKEAVPVDFGKGRVCYIYSKADKMVEWTDIREHAEEARNRGWTVEEEVFEDSAHCAHFSADGERYTEAVKRIWFGEVGGDAEMVNQREFKTKL